MLPFKPFATRTCLALALYAMCSTLYAQTISRTTYTALGQIASVDGPRTDVADITRYGYDGNGNLITVTNALGHVTQLADHDEYGSPRTVTDPNGVVTRLLFDGLGRVVGSETAGATTAFSYDKQGNIVQVTQPGGDWTRYDYDDAQRLIRISNQSGETIQYAHDAAGNITSEQIRDRQSRLVRQQRRTYDELGRLLKTLGASGQVEHVRHDAADNLVASKNGRGYNTANGFDALNRLVSSKDPLGGVTQYTYDAENRPLSVRDPRDITTRYEYDEHGNVVKLISPDTGTSLFSYDDASNLISSTDARGEVTKYRHDALNRLIARTYPQSPALDTRYTYDETTDGNKGVGRLTSITDVSGTLHYTYDQTGKRVAESRTLAALGKQSPERLNMQYDASGNLIKLDYPQALSVTYVRGKSAQIQEVSATVGDQTYKVAGDISYLPFGPLQSLTWGNGLPLHRTHDNDYRLTSQTLGQWKSEYAYDHADNIIKLEQGPLSTARYTYDPLDRLSEEKNAAVRKAYTLDEVGNRTQRTTTALNGETANDQQVLAYAKDSNRLVKLNGQAVTYDASGNQLFSGAQRFVYDAQGRLSEAYQASVQKVADYRYNALGQRVLTRRFDPSSGTVQGLTTYLYDQQGQLLGQTQHAADGTRMSAQYWIWLERMPVAQVDIAFGARGGVTSSNLTYLHTDHLNTPRLASDQSQKLAWRWDSDAYGVGGLDEDVDRDGVATRVDLRFPGQVHDAGSGLNYNYFRDYNPETGRYVQSDPIGLRGGINTYGYVLGNPIKAFDRFGLETTVILIEGLIPHSALHTALSDGSNFLYDPAGSYIPPSGIPRGTGDFFEGPDAQLQNYINYWQSAGYSVRTHGLGTNIQQDQAIIDRAIDLGGAAPFTCALSVSAALGNICGISSSVFPGTLLGNAQNANCP